MNRNIGCDLPVVAAGHLEEGLSRPDLHSTDDELVAATLATAQGEMCAEALAIRTRPRSRESDQADGAVVTFRLRSLSDYS